MAMLRPKRGLVLTCLLLLGLAGCSSDPAEQAQQIKKSLESWSGALALAATQWSQQQVPSRYFRQTLAAANQSFDELQRNLSSIPQSNPQRRNLQQRLSDLRERTQIGRAHV